VLSHPILAEAIETEFVPLMVVNNQPGRDAELLKRFREPAWNYQVVRFLDQSGTDLIPRKDRVWTPQGTAARMVEALEKAKRPVPKYLQSIVVPSGADLGDAAFAIHCFWTGELKLGAIDGVVRTEAGWLDGHEVTRVWYDRSELKFADLLKAAQKVDCARKVFSASADERAHAVKTGRLSVGELTGYRAAKASDQKRQIQGTPYAAISMTAMQATKVNALARRDHQAAQLWLSPTQRAGLKFRE